MRKSMQNENASIPEPSDYSLFIKGGKGTDASKNLIDLENWMGQLPNHLTRIPLIYLAIPGSHNSFSYSLSPSSEVSPDSPDLVQRLGRWCKPITNRIIYNWSVGQKENVVTQLQSGVRYFDIRLVSSNGEMLISHGLFGRHIEEFLVEMCNFLKDHPREAVVLDFQHFYKFNTQDHKVLNNHLEQIFGHRICRRRMLMKDITLDYLWREGCQVIVIYRNSFVNYTDISWPSGSWITPWPNKIKTRELLDFLDKGLADRRDDVGFVSQGILTPTSKYVTFHLGGSLEKLALKNNQELSNWLDTKSCGRHGLNVVLCDFVESCDFCEKVVRLNYKDIHNSGEIKNFNAS